MVLFGFILFVSVAALLAVRAMDIECENPPKPRPYREPELRPYRSPAPEPNFPAERMALRRI
jgi:hypothetical protein